jgi:hypothetical protein
MTPPCPDPRELAAWLDREVVERRAGWIRAHVATCSICTARTASIEGLISDLRAPAGRPPSPAAVRAVLAQLDAAPPRRARAWTWLAGASAAVAIAATALVVWRAPGGRDDAGFQSRGGDGAGALARTVGATLYALPPRDPMSPARGVAAPLSPGAGVRGDTAFALGYRNLVRDRAVWLMSFAIDAAGDVHWLYPGYTTRGADPPAVELATSDREQMMQDSVVLERPAAGELRVVVMISPVALRVSAIEALHRPELARGALQQRFPDAAITELSLRVVP